MTLPPPATCLCCFHGTREAVAVLPPLATAACLAAGQSTAAPLPKAWCCLPADGTSFNGSAGPGLLLVPFALACLPGFCCSCCACAVAAWVTAPVTPGIVEPAATASKAAATAAAAAVLLLPGGMTADMRRCLQVPCIACCTSTSTGGLKNSSKPNPAAGQGRW
jgi:hypothetical protein